MTTSKAHFPMIAVEVIVLELIIHFIFYWCLLNVHRNLLGTGGDHSSLHPRFTVWVTAGPA